MFLVIAISQKRFCNRQLGGCNCSLGHGRKRMHAYDPSDLIWRLGLKNLNPSDTKGEGGGVEPTPQRFFLNNF